LRGSGASTWDTSADGLPSIRTTRGTQLRTENRCVVSGDTDGESPAGDWRDDAQPAAVPIISDTDRTPVKEHQK